MSCTFVSAGVQSREHPATRPVLPVPGNDAQTVHINTLFYKKVSFLTSP